MSDRNAICFGLVEGFDDLFVEEIFDPCDGDNPRSRLFLYKDKKLIGRIYFNSGCLKVWCTPQFSCELADPSLVDKFSVFVEGWEFE